MPFKGIHGHTRHTHEDKVKEKRKSEEKDRPPKNIKKEQQSAVKDEVDLYNTPFEPFAPQNTAHYVNRFFRRAAQTVVHCVLALSPHFYIHTDELFDWMMPYERMGALLSEDAADYIAREKAKLELVEKEQNCTEKMECLNISEEGEDNESDCDNDSDNESENESESDCESEAMHLYAEHMQQQMQQMQQPQIQPQQQQQYSTSFSTTSSMDCPLSDITSHVSAPNHRYCVSPKHVSSIFSSHATNPHTDEDVQVDPKHPDKPVQPMVSHFHPPFLIVDCRRADEYTESHIHGAMNIHYVLPKGPDFIPGERLTFKLPDWVEYDTPIITYCAVGLRSGMMVWELRRRGYKLVKALSGGYYKWVNEGRPIYANSGELTQKVLQQHKLAGIMLRKELKAMQRKERNKEMQDARVAIHHEHDTDFPPCHTYGPCAGKSNMKKVQNKQAKRMKKEGKEKIAGRRRSSIQQMERKNMWEHRHSIIMDEPPKQSLSERSKVKFSTPVSGENENTKEGQRRVSWRERHSLPGGSSSM